MKGKFFILDGHSLLHQSYYAIKSALTNPDGVPVNAVYGFLKTLHKIAGDQEPEYMLMALDTKAPTFRHEMFPEYKAHRKPMPDDLVPQIDILKEMISAHEITIIEKDGFEADDVIGTVARRAGQAGFDVFMVSRDKDLKQLLSESTRIYNPKDGSVYGTKDLLDETGLEPTQFIDLLGLAGDSADNIPGVPGIGPKTACDLLREYKTIDGIYEHLGDIPRKKVAEKLAANRESAYKSRELATIKTDVPIELDFEDARFSGGEPGRLRELYKAHAFTSFLGLLPAEDARTLQGDYKCVNTPDAFDGFMAALRAQKEFAFDTETTGTNAHSAELVGISFSWKEGEAYYLPVKTAEPADALPTEQTLAAVKEILEDPERTIVGQNLKYDLTVMKRRGIECAGRLFDTMVAAHLVSPVERSGLSLDALAREYLGYKTIAISELIGRGSDELTLDRVDLARVTEYACEDADVAWRLRAELAPRLERLDMEPLFEEIEMPLVCVLTEMELSGVKLDTDRLDALSTEFRSRLSELITGIYELAGCEFNIDSPKQLAEILFKKLMLPPQKKTKTGYSTDHGVLETLASMHPLPEKLLEYRTLAKLTNTYVDVLGTLVNAETGRIHTSFNQTVTATGRLSSSKPNLQNIPIRTETGRRIRGAFVPSEPGWKLLSADYSQVELRILAHMSGDASLRKAFEQDLDIHAYVAAQLFGVAEALVSTEQRGVAKAVNFGIIYGQSPFGLARELGIPQHKAAKFIDAYFGRYAGVKDFIEKTKQEARDKGYVTTMRGRRRRIAEINSANRNRRAFAERAAVNTVVQGTAADLIKIAMVSIHKKIRDGASRAKLVLQIHDELVFEVPEDNMEAERIFVEHEMTNAMALDVPLKVTIAAGDNWLEAK